MWLLSSNRGAPNPLLNPHSPHLMATIWCIRYTTVLVYPIFRQTHVLPEDSVGTHERTCFRTCLLDGCMCNTHTYICIITHTYIYIIYIYLFIYISTVYIYNKERTGLVFDISRMWFYIFR